MEQIPDTKYMKHKKWECHGFEVESVTVKYNPFSPRLNEEPEKYFTIYTDMKNNLRSTKEAGECLVEILTPILAPYQGKRICICGLGNEEVQSDSLGPVTIKKIPAMYLEQNDKDKNGRFKKLTTIIPGVFGATNMKTIDMITSLVSASKSDCLVLIDSIVCTCFESLCRSIQISTSSGMTMHYSRNTIDWDTVGVPVISIGAPTVIALEHLNPCIHISKEILKSEMFSTVSMHDLIALTSSIIAYALVRIAYPSFTQQECMEVLWYPRWVNCIW